MGIPTTTTADGRERAIADRWRGINEWLAAAGETQAVWGEYRAHACSNASALHVANEIVAARLVARTMAGTWCVATRRCDDVRMDDPQWQAMQTAECHDDSVELSFPDGSMAHSTPGTDFQWREGALPLVPLYLTQSHARVAIRALSGMGARGCDDAEAVADMVRAKLAEVTARGNSAP